MRLILKAKIVQTPHSGSRSALNDFYSTASGQSFRDLVVIAGTAATTYGVLSPDATARVESLLMAAGPVVVAIAWGLRRVYAETKIKLAAHAAEPDTSAEEIKRRAAAMTWREVLIGAVDEGLDIVREINRLEAEYASLREEHVGLAEELVTIKRQVAILSAGSQPEPKWPPPFVAIPPVTSEVVGHG